jgi:hypothetical protein
MVSINGDKDMDIQRIFTPGISLIAPKITGNNAYPIE